MDDSDDRTREHETVAAGPNSLPNRAFGQPDTLQVDPIGHWPSKACRVEVTLFTVVSIVICTGISAGFLRGEPMHLTMVIFVLFLIIGLHLWFVWRLGHRQLVFHDDRLVVVARLRPLTLTQTFVRSQIAAVRTKQDGWDSEDSEESWALQVQSSDHSRCFVYYFMMLNRFGRNLDWQPILPRQPWDSVTEVGARIAAWANVPFIRAKSDYQA